jgi:hypothetical protein
MWMAKPWQETGTWDVEDKAQDPFYPKAGSLQGVASHSNSRFLFYLEVLSGF